MTRLLTSFKRLVKNSFTNPLLHAKTHTWKSIKTALGQFLNCLFNVGAWDSGPTQAELAPRVVPWTGVQSITGQTQSDA